jgi:thiamine kinase-like enzyme
MDDSVINYNFIHEKITLLIKKKPDLFQSLNNEFHLNIEKLNSISNTIYKVTIKEKEKLIKNLIFKVYGSHDLSREYEEELIRRLSAQGLCPELYDSDISTYRIEEYLENYEDLSYKEVFNEDIIEKLIEILLKFTNIFGYNLMKYDTLEDIKEPNSLFPFLNKFHSKSINVIEKWLKLSIEDSKFIDFKEKICEIKQFVDQFQIILNNLFPANLILTLSHNDVHALNILRSKNTDEIRLMDYEYSCYNLFGFDICNYFIESYFNFSSNSFPYFSLNSSSFEKLFDDPFFLNTFTKYVTLYFKRNPNEESFEKVKHLKEKEYFFRLLCLGSIFWVIVAVSNINLEDNFNRSGFDYLAYSLERLKIYYLGISRIKQICN